MRWSLRLAVARPLVSIDPLTLSQEFKCTEYAYRFVPLRLEGLAIRRMEPHSGEEIVYKAPHDDFPILSLHLHPYVAIYHAYKTFEQCGAHTLSDDQLRLCSDVSHIWSLWEKLAKLPRSSEPRPKSMSTIRVDNNAATTKKRVASHRANRLPTEDIYQQSRKRVREHMS